MYKLEEITDCNYDEEVDILDLNANNQFPYISSVDVDNVVIDFGENDNIISLEILHATKVFDLPASVLKKLTKPTVTYKYYENTEKEVHLIDVTFEGYGGFRVRWDDVEVGYVNRILKNGHLVVKK
jgi:uncharacterized protein YuzE